ncbi:MAG: O-antigen ligase family protein [Saprospiraceae bacterium]|nr:O-antigen ligase family protein [Saprospiraceae bacterium]
MTINTEQTTLNDIAPTPFVKWTWAIALAVLPLVEFSFLLDKVTLARGLVLLLLIGLGSLTFFIQKKSILPKFQTSSWRIYQLTFLAYLLSALLSVTQSYNLAESIWELVKILVWIQLFLWLGFFFIYENSRLYIFIALCISSGIIASLGIYQFLNIESLADENALYAMHSTLQHKNLLASIAFLSLPICGMLIAEKSKHKAWLYVGLLVILLNSIIIFIAQSRAVWLATLGILFIGSILLIYKYIRSKNQSVFRVFGQISLVGILLIVGTYFLYFSNGEKSRHLWDRVKSLWSYNEVKNEHTETIRERLALWDNSLKMSKDHLVLGVGVGNWKLHFNKYGVKNLRAEQGLVNFQRPHNDFLWVLAEQGIIGLVLYLGIFFLAIWAAWQYLKQQQYFRREATGKEHQVFLAFLGILGYGIISFFDFPKERFLHMVYLSLLLAIPIYTYQKSQLTGKPSFSNKNLMVLGVLASALGLWVSSQRIQTEQQVNQIWKARAAKNYNKIIRLSKKATNPYYQLDPAATPLAFYKGEALFYQQKIKEALEAFLQAEQQHPYHLLTLNNIASCYYQQGNMEKANAYFEQVLAYAPQSTEANMNKAAIHFNQKKIAQAAHFLRNCYVYDYETNERFGFFLQKILEAAIDELIQTHSNPKLNQYFTQLKANRAFQTSIHQKAHKNNHTLYKQVLIELLFIAQEQGQLNQLEVDVLRKHYASYLTVVR